MNQKSSKSKSYQNLADVEANNRQSFSDEQIRNTIIEMLKNSSLQGDLSFYTNWLKAIPAPVTPTNKVEVFVLDPETGKLCETEDWKKDNDPERAEWAAIRNEKGETILLHKNSITMNRNPEIKFDNANEAAASFVGGGYIGLRKDWIDVYEAIHTAELNETLELIGGEPIEDEWYWTKEKDSHWAYAANAWIFYGSSGEFGNCSYRLSECYARVFRSFNLK